jgi:pSer/pThr/pTyr-binding forkhead associated (FHA) protein
MSQNKTVFPGLGPEGDSYNQSQNAGNYSRSANRSNGTVYPGMENYTNPVSNEPQQQSGRTQSVGHKPIVGFLYSISRTGVGEYWPVYVGQNIIGSAPDCDIILNEATVSQHHAVLHINKMKKPEKIEATIADSQSTNGTMVNGNSVSVARPPECVNGDVITIGENYELLFILIDVKALGLTQSENFIAIEREEEDEPQYQTTSQVNDHRTRNQQDFPPRFNGPDAPYGGYDRPMDGTVGLDPSSRGGFSGGGTVGME